MYSGIYLDPAPRRIKVAPEVDPKQAFMMFVREGFRDSSHPLPISGITAGEFQLENRSIILPVLDVPAAVSKRQISPEAQMEAQRVKGVFRCSESQSKPAGGCSGSLIFLYYGPDDPYWFVLRSCSEACEFKGESVEMLRRGEHGWDATSAGFIDKPKAEVERLKQQIEKAVIFRLQLP